MTPAVAEGDTVVVTESGYEALGDTGRGWTSPEARPRSVLSRMLRSGFYRTTSKRAERESPASATCMTSSPRNRPSVRFRLSFGK